MKNNLLIPRRAYPRLILTTCWPQTLTNWIPRPLPSTSGASTQPAAKPTTPTRWRRCASGVRTTKRRATGCAAKTWPRPSAWRTKTWSGQWNERAPGSRPVCWDADPGTTDQLIWAEQLIGTVQQPRHLAAETVLVQVSVRKSIIGTAVSQAVWKDRRQVICRWLMSF